MPTAPSKKEFTKIFNNLQEVVDVDDSRGRSVPVNMNFTEEGFITKDTGVSVFGGTAVAVCHSDFNFKKKDGTEYRIRAQGTYLQNYESGSAVWTNLETGTATVTIASPAVVTSTAHGLKAGSKVSFETTGALPTGMTASTVYYVIAAGLTADAFQFSDAAGGSAVNTSGSQSGTHTLYRRYTENAEFGWYVYDDVLYGCNAYENYFKWTGNAFTEYDTAPKGNVLEVYEDRMFVAGVRAEPLTLYYSATGDAEDWSDATKIIKPLGTDSIMTFKNYYGVLMVFKRESIWKISFIYEQTLDIFVPKPELQSGNYGACSRKAVSWVENDLWFFTGTEVRAIGFIDQQTGVFGINKSVISDQIKETLKYISSENLTVVATFYNNRRFYLAIPLGAAAINDTVFVCHLLYKNTWTKYTSRLKANAFDFIAVDDIIYSSVSDTTYGNYGIIKWDDTLTADNGVAIASEVYFKKVENEDFNVFNTYRYLDLIFKDLTATVTVYVRQDANDSRTVKSKQFYVGSVLEGEENALGEVDPGQYWVADSFGESVSATPFLRRRISFLSKAQSLTIGLYNSSTTDQFTISAYALAGFQQPRRLFSGTKITSM
jgi:hypothetical protein